MSNFTPSALASSAPLIGSILQEIEYIDLLLRQANCILMAAQPKRPGKLTLLFPPSDTFLTSLEEIKVQPTPRVVKWQQRLGSKHWYAYSIPQTHLTKRAKGKEEFGVSYHPTVEALRNISLLLDSRKRAVEALVFLMARIKAFMKTNPAIHVQVENDLAKCYLSYKRNRNGRSATQSEWDWFASGGSTVLDHDDDTPLGGADDVDWRDKANG